MEFKASMLKVLLVGICLAMGLTLVNSAGYAVDEAELKNEMEKAYQELKASDPEAAQELIREYREAVKSGEIAVEKTDKEAVKEGGEKGRAQEEGRFREVDPRKMEGEFNALLKEGKSPQEAEKIMRDKYGELEKGPGPDFDLAKPEDRAKALERLDKDSVFLKEKGLSDDDLKALKDAVAKGDKDAEIFDKMDKMGLGPPEGAEGRGGPGDFERGGPPEGMERFGPEGGREFEMSKEEMAERFREEMGREPTAQEKEMMERGDFDRPEFDRPEFDRPEFDRPEFDRPEFDRPEFDRPEFERPEFERPEFERPEFERPEREYEYREPPPPPPPPIP